MKFIIIGGGPAGLAAALSLVQSCSSNPRDIEILEHRKPARSNYVLLNAHSTARLKRLGVYQKLIDRKQYGVYEKLLMVGEGVHPFDMEQLERSDDATIQELIDAQKHGVGLKSVTIADLERAMRDQCLEVGIKCTVAKVDRLLYSNGKYNVVVGNSIKFCDYIILCEGASRKFVSSMKIRDLRISKPEYHIRVNLKRNTGPFVAIGKCMDTELKRLMFGDAAQDRSGIIFIECPNSIVPSALHKGTEYEFHTSFKNGTSMSIPNDYAITEAIKFMDRCGIEPVGVESVSPPFCVQDTRLEKAYVDNVLIIGDAYRTGHFYTGLGTTLAVLKDCDYMIELVNDNFKSKTKFNSQMKSAASIFFDYNTKWYNEIPINKL